MSINVFTFSGRIGRDAETRHTSGGKAVTGFPVAVDVGYGDNKQTLWVDCSMWGERGEKLADYLTKGGVVTVSGEANLQTYQSNGADKTKLACRVNDVQLPPKSGQSDRPARGQERQREMKPDPAGAGYGDSSEGFADDEIPF